MNPGDPRHPWNAWAPPSLDTAQEALKRMYFEAWKDAEAKLEQLRTKSMELWGRATRAEALVEKLRDIIDNEHSVYDA